MLPKDKLKHLNKCKREYKKSNEQIILINSKISKLKTLLIGAIESDNLIEEGKFKIQIAKEKSILASWNNKNKFDKRQLKAAIKDCEASMPERILPSMAGSGMGLYDSLPGMRSAVTGRKAEYFLVQPYDDED